MQMKILHIGEYMQGGVATYAKNLFSADGNNGIENYMILSYYNSEHNWPLPADRIKYYRYKRSIDSIIPAMHVIHQHINDLQPDVIYCHSTWAGVLGRFPYLFCRKKVRIIYNAHGWSFNMDAAIWKKKIYAFVEKLLARTTDKIINVSMYDMKSAVDIGLPESKMIMIYSGVSPEKTLTKNKIKMSADKVNLLFVGRFDPQKGVDFLLKVFREHEKDLRHIHLWIIGDNVVSDGSGIEKKNTENMTFLGWLAHEEISAYYEACDAVIMPSRWEAFGLVAIEAMKYGKPVIVSNRGALPELIQDDVNGWIFDIDDSKSLLRILKKLKNKNSLDKEIITRYFQKNFILEKMLKKTFALREFNIC